MRSVLALLLLALPFALADHQPHVNHRELAKRAKADISKRSTYSGARWTFYATGLSVTPRFLFLFPFLIPYTTQRCLWWNQH